MLSERRFRILARSLFVEMLTLWNLARIPEWRLPEEVIDERQHTYFRYRLKEALAADDSEPLAAVLIEILQVVTGEEPVEGWDPPPLCHGAELLMPLYASHSKDR